jgi:uroporphyrinogen decarboxylase
MGIFTDTIKGIKRERPPVWFMRQAGRVLPSYMKLKEKYTFHELLEDPELAAKVTLLPVEDLGVDAAILFSDILVVPEAMGMKLNFTDKGPVFETPLHDAKNQISQLKPDPSRLNHIYKTIDLIISRKPADVALIGFCGAPFTTFLYMAHGSSKDKEFEEAMKLFYTDRKTTDKLFGMICDLSMEYATTQAKHGIDAFQLFDTHAGILPMDIYRERVLPYVKRISEAVRSKGLPFIYFPKGIGLGLTHMNFDIADFISIDWQTSLADARKAIDARVGLQGNFNPYALSAPGTDFVKELLESYLSFGKNETKWIFNTGHGLMPDNKFENVKFAVEWVKSTNWNR